MHQETGWVNPSLEAIIRLRFLDGAEHTFVIDTGFNGALIMPRSIALSMGLVIVGSAEMGLVNEKIEMEYALSRIKWFGEERDAQVYISEDESLLGTELLRGTLLAIDYVASTVLLESKSISND